MKTKNKVWIVLLLVSFFGFSQTIESINRPLLDSLVEVAPFSEDLAAVRKGNQWGFIDKTGKLVIDFRNDIVWEQHSGRNQDVGATVHYPRFQDGLCIIQELKEDGIPFYGFMDRTGKIAIKPEFLNVTEFHEGRAVGIYCKKTFVGKNKFQLNIYDYSFTEVILNTQGEMIWPIGDRENILMTRKRYKTPEIRTKLLSKEVIVVKNDKGYWELRKIDSTINKE